jgi:hypothetical protein
MGEFRFIGEAALIAKGVAAVHSAVVESAEDLVGKAMEATPVDSGTLKASIHVDSVEMSGMGATATVATGGESSEYAIPVHEGSVAHEIRAKNGKALAWPGAAHPVAAVMHPGAAPTKFLEGPLLANRHLYVEAMRRAASGQF